MNKYNSFKDSGIEWLGDTPAHWSNYRIDWISKIVRGNTGLKKDELLEIGEYVALQYGKTYKVDEVNNTFNFFVNSEYYKRNQTVHRGDTILISTSETIEDLGHSCFYNRDDLGLLGGEQLLLKPKTKLINEKYLYYFSKIFCGEIRKYATGLKVFRFNTDDLKKVFIGIPPIEEQTAIAQYLDAKTQAIDKKINLLTQKAETYKELRKSIINDAVCKGLDKNVKLQESEVGVNPVHWRIGRLKDIAKTMSSGATPHTNITAYYENGILNWVNTGDLNDGVINECQYKISEVAIRDYPNLKVNKIGTLLIAMYGATICKIGLLNIEATTNQACCCINFKKDSYSKFIFYWFLANKSKIISLSVGGTQPNISQGIIAKLLIAIPTKEEQTAIANYLDEKTQKIDAIVSNIGKQIDTLKELRKTLINDVVTGKIKVVANEN